MPRPNKKVESADERRKRVTTPSPPPPRPNGDPARKDKLSPIDQHFAARSERFKTERVKKLFAADRAPTARTSGELKETSHNAAFSDEVISSLKGGDDHH
jgi:hypothetical protein